MEQVVIGVDEVGRGALAGDLLVGACFFLPTPEGLAARSRAKDSKAFAARGLREGAAAFVEKGTSWVLVRRTPADIERLNIRGAVLDAFAEAAATLAGRLPLGTPVLVLWDGKDAPPFSWPVPGSAHRSVVRGDATVPEIAAASVLAKVARDKEMELLAQVWPGYGWERNAGYGTAQHIAGLASQGMTPLHRSWSRKFTSL